MSLDGSNIDARDPAALLDALGIQAIDGSIMTSRMENDGAGKPPPTLSSGQAPAEVANPGIAVSSEQSMIIPAVTGAYPAASIPDIQSDASVFKLTSSEPAEPALDQSADVAAKLDAPRPSWIEET